MTTETVKAVSLLLVFLSFSGLIVRFLLPENRLSDTAKTVISVVLLTCAISPLFRILTDLRSWDFSLPTVSDEACTVDYQAYADAGEREVRRLVDETVRTYTAVPYETEVEVHIESDMRIDINRIRLRFAEWFPEMTDLAFALRKTLGVDPEMETEARE